MHRVVLFVMVAALACFLKPLDAATTTAAHDRVWFAPGPGTIDYLDLFDHPEQWPHARQLVNVFKFYQQHTQTPAPPIVGPNSYDALVRANAFSLLNQWGIKTAIEVGAVKDFYCTPDATGMNAAIADSLNSIRNVQTAGGTVSYLAIDEPFVSGRGPVCGGPGLEPTADRVATYVAGVHAAFPSVQVGLIEAYPFSNEATIERIIDLLDARNAKPAFLHMDTDWRRSGAEAFESDMLKLKAFASSQSIPFGNIIVGADGDADALYAADAYGVAELIATTYKSWPNMPDNLIIQSWAQSRTGLYITPTNLPETVRFTHTNELRDVWHRLRGATGGPTDTAVDRR